MALYPSLEDMKVDQLMKAQVGLPGEAPVPYNRIEPVCSAHIEEIIPSAPMHSDAQSSHLPVYPHLGEYMGLELSTDVIAANMPEYLDKPQNQVPSSQLLPVFPAPKLDAFLAPLSGESIDVRNTVFKNGVRELILCKNAEGKVGLRVQEINNGVFVSLVMKDSPAAMAGLRFGDQILQVNGTNVAGFSKDRVHDIFKKSPVNGISVVVRDRPFERTITLHKDSAGRIGFSFKDGRIINVVVDSSAARNGILTEHNLLEVNGQNVIGLKDKDITKLVADGGNIITVTIIPTFIYQHMTKRMSTGLIKSSMDHSIPAF